MDEVREIRDSEGRLKKGFRNCVGGGWEQRGLHINLYRKIDESANKAEPWSCDQLGKKVNATSTNKLPLCIELALHNKIRIMLLTNEPSIPNSMVISLEFAATAPEQSRLLATSLLAPLLVAILDTAIKSGRIPMMEGQSCLRYVPESLVRLLLRSGNAQSKTTEFPRNSLPTAYNIKRSKPVSALILEIKISLLRSVIEYSSY